MVLPLGMLSLSLNQDLYMMRMNLNLIEMELVELKVQWYSISRKWFGNLLIYLYLFHQLLTGIKTSLAPKNLLILNTPYFELDGVSESKSINYFRNKFHLDKDTKVFVYLGAIRLGGA